MKITNMKAGDRCPRCQSELYEVIRKTRDAILANGVVVRSVPMTYFCSNRVTYVICPACDAYACGLDQEEGFDLLDKLGNVTEVQAIDFL